MQKILIMFMIYSIIGWLWETPFVSITTGKLVNRGFLHGPIIPIYGFANVTMAVSMDLIKPYLPNNKLLMMVISIAYIAVIASVWEYLTSFLLELAFKTRWWDYSKHKFNLNGRIALSCSIGWGFAGFFLWYHVNTPLINTFYKLTPDVVLIVLTSFYTTLVIDSFLTIRDLISLRAIIIKLNDISEEMSDKVLNNVSNIRDAIEEQLNNNKKSIDEFIEDMKVNYGKLGNLKDAVGIKTHEFNKVILNIVQRKDDASSNKQINSVNSYNMLLEKSKRYSRFLKNYPEVSSKKFSDILVILKNKK